MFEFYAEIRLVHISAALASGGLFLLRGLALFSGFAWAKSAPLRYLSYAVDTILLTAALMLMTIVQQYPFVDAWLTVKVILVVAYIVLGIAAFRIGRSRPSGAVSWIAALTVFGFIFSIARAHHPLGFLAGIVDS